jgi:transposase
MVHDLRAMLDAVFYVVKNGVEWRALPVDFPPPDRSSRGDGVVGHSHDHGPPSRTLRNRHTIDHTMESTNIPPRPRQDGGLRSFIYRLCGVTVGDAAG